MSINPRILKGFRDFLPQQESLRQSLIRTLEDGFAAFGFEPIDTPILEYTEVLLGKGGGETDKQVYRFTDHGKRDVAMRFDLTVPFARYMALHRNELYLPFKRYHISKVFRGENTQRGRYREFTQCDFDIVGTDSASADLEIITMMHHSFRRLHVPGVEIHVSHRGVFNRLLERYNVREHSEAVLRTVDKLRKVGADATRAELADIIGAETADRVLEFISSRGTMTEVIDTMERLLGGAIPETERLRHLAVALDALELSDDVVIDPSITRGLDYYTGVVFETFLHGVENIGSVCSGGRYDDLISLYSKESMPGVGASIGLDRLIAALEELGIAGNSQASADVLITMQDPQLLSHYHRIAATLRSHGIRCEVYPDERKLGQQFAFAERKHIPFALICGRQEYDAGTVNVRVLASRTNLDGIELSALSPAFLDRYRDDETKSLES
ncbi:MAG TPA: histidine--tRNA ligase [Alkalispirochaeta sp.]|nr:histidine--tRNA ligase [Alkalispirochaeta sp.]